jgi:hypothetical protein
VAITNGKLEGRITISGTAAARRLGAFTDDSGGPTNVDLTSGDYYWSSSDSGANDFLAQVQTDINAAMGQTWTVALSAGESGTGKVTISCTASVCTVTFDVTTLRDLLGFTGNISSSPTTGANHVKALWLPDGPPRSPYGLADAGIDEADLTSTESPAGHVKTLVYQRKTIQPIEWMGCSRAKTRIDGESTTNESFQKFRRDVLFAEETWCPDIRVRVYPDADTDGTYTTYAHSGPPPEPTPLIDGWIEQWNVALPRLVKVP